MPEESTGIEPMTTEQQTNAIQPIISEEATSVESTSMEQQTNVTQPTIQEKKSRRKFEASLNYDALIQLEGKSLNSFLELVRKVILLDGKPYSEAGIKFTTSKKDEYLHIIEQKAKLKFLGNKCYIKLVLREDSLNNLNGFHTEKHMDKLRNE